MCLKETENKNTAWNSVQYNLFYWLDGCQKCKRTTLGICRISEFIVDCKNRCWQQTALDAGDWINGLHYNHMYTDFEESSGD